MILVLAFVVLLVLKLTHAIAWSWWIVGSPLLVLGALYAVFLFFFAAVTSAVMRGLKW